MSIVLLCTHISVRCLDNVLCKTTHCCRAVAAHAHNKVTYLARTVSYEKAASTSYMNYCHKAALRLTKMQDKND
jgi:hypothetical protein